MAAVWTVSGWRPVVEAPSAPEYSVSISLSSAPVGQSPVADSSVLTGVETGRHVRLPVPDLPLRPLPAQPLDLNPAPVLQEEFSIDMASLAVRTPMAAEDRQNLQTALNSVADRLPDWTDPERPLAWRDGDYEFTVQHRSTDDPMALDRAVMSVSTEMDGLALTASVPVKRMAFSHFAQLVDRWDPEVNLAGDRIFGRLHSNSGLFVEGRSKPRVTGETTVVGRVSIEGRGDRSRIFSSGLVTGVPRMPLPQRPVDAESIATAHRIGGSAWIRFNSDGSYEWAPLEGQESPQRVEPGSYPWLISGAADAELRVEGVVRGSVLVYSPHRISVTGHLRCAADPRQPGADDFLGLVSDGNVEIAAPDLTGPGSLDICAAIYAGRQFRVRRYRNREGGVLAIYGSLTAGSISATEPRYKTRLEFDSRLEELRPAWFPMTNRYVVASDELYWTVESAGR